MPRLFLPALALTAALITACDPPQTPEPADTVAPSLMIASNANTLAGGGTVKLTATASDNVAVTSVSFYKGNTLMSKDVTAPYEVEETFAEPTSDMAVQYRVVAADAAGNITEKAVTVTVTPAAPAALPVLTVRLSRGLGRYQDASAKGRTVTAYGIDFSGDWNQKTVLTTGVVKDDYTIALAPIAPEKIAPILKPFPTTLPENCTGTIELSTPEMKIFLMKHLAMDISGLGNAQSGEFPLTVFNPDGSNPHSHTAYPDSGPNSFIYADRSGTIKSKAFCKDNYGGMTRDYDLSLKGGWNFIQSHYTFTEGKGSEMTYRILPATNVILAMGSPF
ncbi:Ig-like domain-containing protein [Deinococcus arcticus]|uniref:Ig-like domain-containing protein n=1 Tax=Deinococcus arcticus TaxID=2136176 RepID=UPI0011B27305|nr:Ig-like domain-containing protein [Deinococcus arcticus]